MGAASIPKPRYARLAMSSGIRIGVVCACTVVVACGGRVLQRVGDGDATGGAAGYGAATSFGGYAGGTNPGGGLLGGTVSSGGFGPIGETGGFFGTAGGTAIGGFGPGGAANAGGFAGSGGGIPDGGECVLISSKSQFTEVDLIFVVDQSLAMGCITSTNPTPWLAMTGGIEDFAKNPSRPDVALGLDFFGQLVAGDAGSSQTSCFATSYEPLAVAPTLAPGNISGLFAALETHGPSTDGALSAAYAGVMTTTLELKAQNPFNEYAIVLVTGTEPDVCAGTPPTSTAAAGSMGGVPTFVITTPTPSNTCDATAPPGSTDLAGIASLGGSGTPYVLDPLGSLRAATVAAIDAIVDHLSGPGTCSFDLGNNAPRFDETVTVSYDDASGVQHGVVEVTKGSCDPTEGGWYWDDPKSPTKIDLCDASCKAASAGGSVQIQIGCNDSVGPAPPF